MKGLYFFTKKDGWFEIRGCVFARNKGGGGGFMKGY